MHSTLSLRSFPNAAFETVPVFIWVMFIHWFSVHCFAYMLVWQMFRVTLFLFYIRCFLCFLMYFNHAESDVCLLPVCFTLSLFLVRIPPCVSWFLFQLLSHHDSLKYESLWFQFQMYTSTRLTRQVGLKLVWLNNNRSLIWSEVGLIVEFYDFHSFEARLILLTELCLLADRKYVSTFFSKKKERKRKKTFLCRMVFSIC